MAGIGNSAHTVPRLLEASKWHPIGSEGGVVVDHHGRGIDVAIGVHRACQIVGVDRRLE